MKKCVHTSNLALRFYKNNGWTKEELEQYIISGSIDDTELLHGDKNEWAYLRPSAGTKMDLKRLFEEKVSAINRFHTDKNNLNDLEYLESFNW